MIQTHRGAIALCGAAIAFIVAGFAWVFAALSSIPGPLILHFNDGAGITQVGSLRELAFAGIFAFVTAIVNLMIALELDRRDRVLGKLLAAMTLVVAVLLFIACAAIMNVNG
jgi:hypothetical protein